jgi:hypothetical protein
MKKLTNPKSPKQLFKRHQDLRLPSLGGMEDEKGIILGWQVRSQKSDGRSSKVRVHCATMRASFSRTGAFLFSLPKVGLVGVLS